MENPLAPFDYGREIEARNFANRKAELKHLVQNFSNRVNTMLISPRRWGKSSLVKQAGLQTMAQFPEVKVGLIDLFSTRSEAQFFNMLATEVIRATNDKLDDSLQDLKKWFKSIIPVFSYAPDPNTSFSMNLNWEEVKKNPGEILDLAEEICKARQIRLVLCIDEFQNVGYFEESLAFQKLLRAHWQRHQSVSYCLYGSKRQMLTDYFTKRSMPFYRFGDVIFLEKISIEDWVPFIVRRFLETGKLISEELAAYLAQTVENHPYFVQQLAQNTWFSTEGTVIQETIDDTLFSLLQRNSMFYQREVEQLSSPQLYYLKALADGIIQTSSAEVIRKYQLGTSANVVKIKKVLENREVIDTMAGRPEFVDPLFRLWLKRIYFHNQ